MPGFINLYLSFLLFSLSSLSAVMAQVPGENRIRTVISAFDSLSKAKPAEKLYLHLDRPYYSVTDTIRFKAYLFTDPLLSGSSESGVLYVELTDENNSPVKRFKFPMIGGLSWGDISLDPAEFTEGRYTLRAFTKWMLNFKGSYVFSKGLYIDGQQALRTAYGTARAKVNPASPADLQFMPEGGGLVNSLASRVAFKAIGTGGMGVTVSGKIVDDLNRTVVPFRSVCKGMGSFDLSPEEGRTYYALLSAPGNTSAKVPLPAAAKGGTTLSVTGRPGDSLEVELNFSAGTVTNMYYLIGQSRGVVCYAAAIHLKERNNVISLIPKAQFPTGVARFMLLDSKFYPLNERAVYIDRKDALELKLTESVFKDSISLELEVKKTDGSFPESSFSVAVTADSLMAVPEMQANILTGIFMQGDIKGNIEDPAFYLQGSAGSEQALDLLMLTQGWTAYNREDLFGPPPELRFKAENGFTISGRSVSLINNKPLANSLITLNGKRPAIYLDTLSSADGTFLFKNIPPTSNETFVLTARNQKGKDANVMIRVDEDPIFQSNKVLENLPPVWLSDSAIAELQSERASFLKRHGPGLSGNNVLEEVAITGKKIIKGSKNRNFGGRADLVINETELLQTPEITLLELLQKRIKDFRLVRAPGVYSYAIGNKPLRLVFDGTDPFYAEQSPEINFLADFKARNVRGIEVMNTPATVQAYDSWFSPKAGAANISSTGGTTGMLRTGDIAYVEITTYGGEGPMIKQRSGMQIVRSIPFSFPHKFYHPRYLPENKKPLSYEPLVFWDPSIISDTNGKARFNFYHRNKPGRYTVIIEGADMNGSLGSLRQQFVVK